MGYVYIHSYICFDFETQVAVAMNLFCIVFFSRFHFKNLLFWRSMDTLRIDQKKKERKKRKETSLFWFAKLVSQVSTVFTLCKNGFH